MTKKREFVPKEYISSSTQKSCQSLNWYGVNPYESDWNRYFLVSSIDKLGYLVYCPKVVGLHASYEMEYAVIHELFYFRGIVWGVKWRKYEQKIIGSFTKWIDALKNPLSTL